MTNSPQGLTGLLNQVPAAVDRVRREIVLARFLGKLAVDQGTRELRQRLDAALNSASAADAQRPHAPPRVTATEPGSEVRAEVDGPGASPIEAEPRAAASSLALSDYDHLPGSDIVAKLASLDAAERDAIEAYERAGRGRRTVLGKLEQLRGEP